MTTKLALRDEKEIFFQDNLLSSQPIHGSSLQAKKKALVRGVAVHNLIYVGNLLDLQLEK